MSIFEIKRGSVFSLPEPIPIYAEWHGEVDIYKIKKGEKKMELTRELLDDKKAKLNAEFNAELQVAFEAKKEELIKIGETAKEHAIANAKNEINALVSSKFEKAGNLLDEFYALLPQETTVVG